MFWAAIVLVAFSPCVVCGWAGFGSNRVLVGLNCEDAVNSANKLVGEQRGVGETIFGADEAPESLRFRGLDLVVVHPAHVDLVTYRHPDGWAGARIWVGQPAPENEKPSRCSGITRFLWDKEADPSESNQP